MITNATFERNTPQHAFLILYLVRSALSSLKQNYSKNASAGAPHSLETIRQVHYPMSAFMLILGFFFLKKKIITRAMPQALWNRDFRSVFTPSHLVFAGVPADILSRVPSRAGVM